MNTNNFFEFSNEQDIKLSGVKPWNIYVTDDDDDVLRSTKNALENFTYKEKPMSLHFFKSANETIKKLSDDNQCDPEVAVIILDIVMEDIGYEVIRYLRHIKMNNITQIIVRTGQAGKAIKRPNEITEEYEINDFIDKSDNTLSRIRVAVSTSLRMYELVKNLSLSNKSLEVFNSSLVEFCSKNKGTMSNSKDETELLVNVIFNHLNKNFYKEKKKITPEAVEEVLQMKITGLMIIFTVLYKAMMLNKNNEITADDIKRCSSEPLMMWQKEEAWLENLYKALCGNKIGDMKSSEKFISPDICYEVFRDHHLGLAPTPITWLGNYGDLLYLYYALHDAKYISDGIWDIIHNEIRLHYCTKKGMIDSDVIKNTKSKFKIKSSANVEGKTVITEDWIWDNPNKKLIDEIVLNVEE